METLEKLVETAQVLHSCQSLMEQLFAGQVAVYDIYSKMQNAHGVQHYVMNALLVFMYYKRKIYCSL